MHTGFGWRTEEKRPLGRPWLRWQDNINFTLKKLVGRAWSGFVKCRYSYQSTWSSLPENNAMKHQVTEPRKLQEEALHNFHHWFNIIILIKSTSLTRERRVARKRDVYCLL
jgi:hypothetical protein